VCIDPPPKKEEKKDNLPTHPTHPFLFLFFLTKKMVDDNTAGADFVGYMDALASLKEAKQQKQDMLFAHEVCIYNKCMNIDE
jgi:hypothetical protein